MSEPAFSLQLRGAPGGALVLPLPAMLRFDALRQAIRELFGYPPGRYRGARVRLDLAQRELDMMEIRRLIHLCKDEFEVEVVGLICSDTTIHRMAERELKLKISSSAASADLPIAPAQHTGEAVRPAEVSVSVPPGDEPATTVSTFAAPPPSAGMSGEATAFQTEQAGTEIVAPPGEEEDETREPEAQNAYADLGQGGARVLTVRTHLRSGHSVRFAGDVHIWGDVNPGAQVIAGGSILVFGALKGMAHAGTREDHAMILAFDLRPTQLRIGKVIGVVPGANPDQPTRGFNPEFACVHDGQLVVDNWRGKLPSHLVSKETLECA